MTAFVDVGLIRIQDYLGRSRTLWGRRGASDVLLHATRAGDDLAALSSVLGQSSPLTTLTRFPTVTVNPDALHVDGVVSLTSADAGEAWGAGVALAQAIRAQLPAATVKVILSDADRYSDTLASTSRPDREQTFWPRPYEFPLHKLCDECGQSGASKFLKDKASWVCPDCWERRPRMARRQLYASLTKRPRSGFLAEQRLWQAVSRPSLGIAESFETIAALPATTAAGASARRATEDNHLATIFADGNGLGGLFHEARDRAAKEGTQEALDSLRLLSEGIKDATAAALLDATLAILRDDDTVLPAVPHIQGGDDVLVTVPALRVWPFVRTFLTTSEELFGAFGDAGRRPSMSLGVVVCHRAFPIGDQVELAERLLRRAKNDVHGDGMSFAWTDVTWDGPQPVDARATWTLAELNAREAALAAATDLPGSTRSSLRTILSTPDPTGRQSRLRHHASRMPEADRFVSAVLGAGWSRAGQLVDTDARLLLDVLSLGRWWTA